MTQKEEKNILNLSEKIISKELEELKNKDYILADTRIPYISLYDHLILTSGIAVAIVKELLLKYDAERIAGVSISEKELVATARLAALLHDYGKIDDYKNHVEFSIKYSRYILNRYNVGEQYSNLILKAIERHHISANPRTLLEKTICLADSLASAGDRPELTKAESWKEIVEVFGSTIQLYNAVFEGEEGLVLILGDVDKIKSYVYETSALPEIRGASEILNELNLEELKKLFVNLLSAECLIYNGGGSFLAIVPKSLADEIVRGIENLYLDKTKTVTITCVKSKPLNPLNFAFGLKPYSNEEIKQLKGKVGQTGVHLGKWLIESHYGVNDWFKKRVINGKEFEICKAKGFGEIVSDLSAKLRAMKDMKESVPFFEALPIGKRCDSCGKRVASELDQSEHICYVCKIKRDRGRGEKLIHLEDFANCIGEEKRAIYEKMPSDLDELAELYDNYIAFVYADGNDIGSLLEEAKTPAHYRHISETLQKSVKSALYDALHSIYRAIEDRYGTIQKLPFEIINIGGDDIALIVAAPFAFRFSKLFLEGFEKETKKLAEELGKDKITMSLGMTICKKDYPIYFAERIAEGLLRSAKKRAKQEKNCSTINYIYLTTSIATESAKELIEMYKLDKAILTLRPYTLDEFKDILKWTKKILKIPTTQRENFAQALCRGREGSTAYILYQIARMGEKGKELKLILDEISAKFGCDVTKIWKYIEGENGSVPATPFLDMLEIAKIGGEFIEA